MYSMTTTNVPPMSDDRLEELERTCFIIMPFGKKKVGSKMVDFDLIFNEIFEPAVHRVTDSGRENARMVARRTDKDAFSGAITQEMFEYIMYSRLAFGDISGFNANVMYEIGVRHAIQESGTVLFRQSGHEIPFDINTIKIFEYALDPKNRESVQIFISSVISETLRRNRLDSPVRLALRAQWAGAPLASDSDLSRGDSSEVASGPPPTGGVSDYLSRNQVVEDFMRDAQEAINIGDLEMARILYWGALRFEPDNIIARMRLGLLLKRLGRHYEAMEEFVTVNRLCPSYGEAWKEKGIVLGLIARALTPKARRDMAWLPDGHDALVRATELIPKDYDAWASLGGVLRNVRGDHARAYAMYAHAAKISNGHPYPLLNAIKEQARATGALTLSDVQAQLKEAAKLRQAQAQATPPTDAPWCFFDLAELQLYQRNSKAFQQQLALGISACNARWQLETCRDALKSALLDNGIKLPGLAQGIKQLDAAIADWSKR